MVHIPATTESLPPKEKAAQTGVPTTTTAAAAAAAASSMLPPRSTCLLFSGGHGGLVRCSVIPFRPSRKHRWRTGTKKSSVKAALERLGDEDKAAASAAHTPGSASTTTGTTAGKKGLSATAAKGRVRKPATPAAAPSQPGVARGANPSGEIGPAEAGAPRAGGAASPAMVASAQRPKSQHRDSRGAESGVAAGCTNGDAAADGAAAGKKPSRGSVTGSRSRDEVAPAGSGETRGNKKRKTEKATSATSAPSKRAELTISRDRNKAGGTDKGEGEMGSPSGTPGDQGR